MNEGEDNKQKNKQKDKLLFFFSNSPFPVRPHSIRPPVLGVGLFFLLDTKNLICPIISVSVEQHSPE